MINMKNDKYIEFWLEKPDDSAGFLLWQISNLWQRKIHHANKHKLPADNPQL